MGGSTLAMADGIHALCHPVTDADAALLARPEGPRSLSCLETIGYVAVEHSPTGRRPPVPIPQLELERARWWISMHS